LGWRRAHLTEFRLSTKTGHVTLNLALDIIDRQPCGVIGCFRRRTADKVSSQVTQADSEGRVDRSLVGVPFKNEVSDWLRASGEPRF
jgi:hypothetical protein